MILGAAIMDLSLSSKEAVVGSACTPRDIQDELESGHWLVPWALAEPGPTGPCSVVGQRMDLLADTLTATEMGIQRPEDHFNAVFLNGDYASRESNFLRHSVIA